ncbi:unnamed protein product [Chironomus riparius]|uniref:Uncharacterized protein n=1 Tax=Chironomus riparius TaxID=315576 RepID=A0A9N9SA07_9DIPT|nr:unnamed protein product [Chironomus riparius]
MKNSEENLNFSEASSEDDEKSTEDDKNNLAIEIDTTLTVKLQNSPMLKNQTAKKRINIEMTSESYFTDNFMSSGHASIDLETQNQTSIVNLPGDVFEVIFKLMQIVGGSNTILRSFVLIIGINSLRKITENPEFFNVPFKNIELDFEHLNNYKEVSIVFEDFKASVETLKLKNVNLKSYHEFSDFIVNSPNIKSLTFENCCIQNLYNEVLPTILSLRTISIINCNENVFKVCQFQTTLVKISIQSDAIELPSELFYKISKNFVNLEHLILLGQGTRSFFDSQNYPLKLKKLEATMLTYNWYIGMKTQRIKFLTSQLGYLKELKIHQFPNDFDGGRVLKFILNHMNLETIYYGKIPLVLHGQKQEVKRFEASETQICSTFEMFEQFPSITSFLLNLSTMDIATQEIEKIVNPRTNLFDWIEEFEVVDNSFPRNIFGVFLGLLNNLRNIKKLTLKTQDININVLLEEFLPKMKKLSEIYITSTDRRYVKRFEVIKAFVPNLKKLCISQELVKEARQIFDGGVEIIGIN